MSKKTTQRDAALKAWKTMRGPVWKTRRSERLSKEALEDWAHEFGFRVMFLDADSGYPRTGIADAVLLRIKPKAADQVELYLVQLKGGDSGFSAREMGRLESASAAVKAVPLIILHDGKTLHFLGGEPSFTTREAPRLKRKRYAGGPGVSTGKKRKKPKIGHQ